MARSPHPTTTTTPHPTPPQLPTAPKRDRTCRPRSQADTDIIGVRDGSFVSSPLLESCNPGSRPADSEYRHNPNFYAGARIHSPAYALKVAAETTDRAEVVKLLLEAGAHQPEYEEGDKCLVARKAHPGLWKPIHWAIYNGYKQIAMLLVSAGRGKSGRFGRRAPRPPLFPADNVRPHRSHVSLARRHARPISRARV